MRLINLSILVVGILFQTAKASNRELPVEAYGHLPHTSSVQLSPDGSYVSYMLNHKGELLLTVVNQSTDETKYILKFDNLDSSFNWYGWANNNTLLVSASYPSKRGDTETKERRLLKFNIEKDKEARPVLKPRTSENIPQIGDKILSLLPHKPNKILMALDIEIPGPPDVYEVDLNSNKRNKVKRRQTNIYDWYADQQGNIRFSRHIDETKITYRYRLNASMKWKDVWQYDVVKEADIDILGFDLDPNVFYIRAANEGRYALYKVKINAESLKFSRELIFSDPKYDFDGEILRDPSGLVIGYSTSSLSDNRVYWDEGYLKLHRGIKNAMPESNTYIMSMSDDRQKYVLFTESLKDAGSYYIGNRQDKTLSYLANRYPTFLESDYSIKKTVTYTARDKLQIEGYLTHPANYKNGEKRPAIILPHGGPFSRDYYNFDYMAELFSNRGYLVFQPNFRGSTGYGVEFGKAGIAGWGQAMQDDLQDAANWLVSQGYTDKGNMCIAGGSYGGYAALMSAVKHSETFKCAASFAGVTDLGFISANSRRYINGHIERKLIGKGEIDLGEISPANFAEKIDMPILLIHGSKDRVVPVKHSRQMHYVLENEDKDVTYIELEKGDHYLSNQNHRIKTLKAMVEFFDLHLKQS